MKPKPRKYLSLLRVRLVILNCIFFLILISLFSAPALAGGSEEQCRAMLADYGCQNIHVETWGSCIWNGGCGWSFWADDWCFGGTITGTNCWEGVEEPVTCSWSGCSGCC